MGVSMRDRAARAERGSLIGVGPGGLALVMALVAIPLCAALTGPDLGRALSPVEDAYDPERMVLIHATLPRLAMALLCGAALAASGAILQQVLRNPLASPTTLGVDAGARLALAVASVMAPGLLGLGRDLVALGPGPINRIPKSAEM